MAEKKPNAALRPIQGVRRSTTPSGVIHVRTYQSGQYVVVGNHLAQHRELSLTAIGLATHILSVPEGTPVDIRSLAERFPEGRDRIAAALRELEAHGYLQRVREHTESGRLVTRTYAHHTPVAAAPAPLRVARTGERRLSAGANPPAAPEEDDQPPQPDAPEPVPAPVAAPKPATTPEAHGRSRDPRHDKAVTLLAGLRRADDRLILSRRDVDRLAPAVTAWFDSGATAAVIHHALTADLPADLKSPARLLGYRLDALLPVPLPARPAPPPDTGAEAAAGRRRDPLQNCDGCDRAFRAPHPGHCRDCRAEQRVLSDESACAA
ncbi:helix-turn-helix domain-containing protein [Streptomyces sp. NPDC048192]|uniref:helix-turn-helix domain-containing protein n=1 Tax=unclassified Streptomyces TaxID=2593676 RepID=UPI0037114999